MIAFNKFFISNDLFANNKNIVKKYFFPLIDYFFNILDLINVHLDGKFLNTTSPAEILELFPILRYGKIFEPRDKSVLLPILAPPPIKDPGEITQ